MGVPSRVRIGTDLAEFPGRSFNLLVEQWFRNQAQLGRNSKGGSGPGQILTVKAKNVTGATLQYGHCVALEGLAIDYDDKENQQYSRPLLKANKPTSALKHSILGVALNPIANNAAGTFVFSGPAWLRCNYTDTAHDFIELTPDQATYTELARSSNTGQPILAREMTGPGEQWVLALLGGSTSGGDDIRWGEVTAEIAARLTDWSAYGGGTVQLMKKDGGTGMEPDGDPINVINWLPVSFAVGATVEIDMATDPPEVREGTCPEEP